MAGKKDKREKSGRRRQQHQGSKLGPALFPAMAVVILLAVHFVLAITSVLHKSNTYDELAHLTRGYSYYMTGDYRLGPPHPPFAHIWAALPGHSLEVKFPSQQRDLAAWHKSDVWNLGRLFFYYKNLGNGTIIDSLLWRGRTMIAVLSLGLGLIVFFWSRRLFGTAGGLVSLTLYAFSPTMLAHARLVTTDCAVALFFLSSLAAIWWMLHRVTIPSVLLSGCSLALLFMSKMSAPLIIPAGAALLVFRLIRSKSLPVVLAGRRWEITSRAKQLCCFSVVLVVWIAIVWSGLWTAYGWRYSAMVNAQDGVDTFYSAALVPEGQSNWEYQERHLSPTLCSTLRWMRDYRVLPEAYLYSALYSAQTARGRNSFMNGQWSKTGFHWFFPYAFAVKTPLPLMGLMVACLGLPLIRRHSAGDEDSEKNAAARNARQNTLAFLYRTAPFWVFLVVYWLTSLSSNLNIGHRHILPTYPMLFILCGAATHYWTLRSLVGKVALALPIGLFVIASLLAYPNYLSYFNSFAGGSDNAYRHLVDSSLDWGQDLPGLADYINQRRGDGYADEIFVSYFGSGQSLAISHFGVKATPIPLTLREDATGSYSFCPGMYAISATNLQQVYNYLNSCDWSEELQKQYERLGKTIASFEATADTVQARAKWATGRFRDAHRLYYRLAFARLCAYLRLREPEAVINHTILIYEVNERQLQEALNDPPAKWASEQTDQ